MCSTININSSEKINISNFMGESLIGGYEVGLEPTKSYWFENEHVWGIIVSQNSQVNYVF